jgi:hypothetical protein
MAEENKDDVWVYFNHDGVQICDSPGIDSYSDNPGQLGAYDSIRIKIKNPHPDYPKGGLYERTVHNASLVGPIVLMINSDVTKMHDRTFDNSDGIWKVKIGDNFVPFSNVGWYGGEYMDLLDYQPDLHMYVTQIIDENENKQEAAVQVLKFSTGYAVTTGDSTTIDGGAGPTQ